MIAAIAVIFVATGIVFWLPGMHMAGHRHHVEFAMAIAFFFALWALAHLSTPTVLDRQRGARARLGLAAALFGMMTFLIVVVADGPATVDQHLSGGIVEAWGAVGSFAALATWIVVRVLVGLTRRGDADVGIASFPPDMAGLIAKHTAGTFRRTWGDGGPLTHEDVQEIIRREQAEAEAMTQLYHARREAIEAASAAERSEALAQFVATLSTKDRALLDAQLREGERG